ncbi:MAG: hypothetical protein ACI9DJ_001508 [Algoriphagus sp.]|jgi:hypothetical protein
MHDLITIVEREFGYIGYCKCCNSANLAFKNSLFCFDLPSLKYFYNTIKNGDALRSFSTSHGKDYLIHTPISNYYIMLDVEEIANLLLLINDSFLYLDSQHSADVNNN